VEAIAEPLQAALDELERRLRDFGAPVVERLRPGLTSSAIAGELRQHDLEAPVELRTLWGWHDGTDSDLYRDNRLVGGWHLLRLDQAVEHHRVHREIYDDPSIGLAGYPRGWFPTLVYTNGPFAAIDCTGDTEGERPLYVVDPHGELPADPPTPQFGSLRQLVEILVRFFDDGLVVRDDVLGGAKVEWERIPDDLREIGYW
jgi:hypothetical protein